MTTKEKTSLEKTESTIRRRTWLSFITFFLFIGLVSVCWFKLKNQPASADGVQPTLRKALNKNEKVFNKTFSKQNLAKTYPIARAAKIVRVNGKLGLQTKLDEDWRLHVVRSKGDTLLINLDDIKKLPKTTVVFDFKCIEGWNQISFWGGVKFSDFIKAYHLEKMADKKYIGLVTPDGAYYVGIDMPSAMHPQTLLCYEMNGYPLPLNQGYPLRLIIPVKYGIKSLKRIGTLSFNEERPRDYWFERGYDYYAGL